MNRRQYLGVMGGILGTAALAACSSPAPAGNGTTTGSTDFTALYFEGAGQDIVPARLLEELGKLNKNLSIKTILGGSRYPEVIAAFKANGTALTNFGIFTAGVMAQGSGLKMFDPIKASDIGVSGLNSGYDLFPGDGIPFNTNLIGLVYNPELADAPRSWLDLLDPKYRGKVGLFDAPQGILFSGLWAVNEALGGDPATLDKGFEAFSKAAKDGQFGTLYNSNQTQFDAFSRGDVVVGASILATQENWKAQGAAVDYAVPSEGQLGVPLYLATVAGSDAAQVKASHDLMKLMLAPENVGEYNELTFAGSVFEGVELPPAQQGQDAFSPEAMAKVLQVDWVEQARVQAQLVERWNRDVKAQLT